MTDLVANTVRGTIFGAAVTAAGVHHPKIILDQLALREFHMLKVFLTASASSAIILALVSKRQQSKRKEAIRKGDGVDSTDCCVPPTAASLGTGLGRYDGNVLGGALIGTGMALTGACPGTVLVQAAAGAPSALPVLAGSLVGGLLHSGFIAPRVKQAVATTTKTGGKDEAERATVSARFQLDENTTLLGFEAMMWVTILVFSQAQSTPNYLLNPVLGGLIIGGAQLASVALAGRTLGVSRAFDQAAQWVWYLAGSKQQPAAPPSDALQFVGSLMLGSYLLSHLRPEFALAASDAASVSISPVVGFLGGLVMIVGARLAGGCTSGHGISGMAMFSLSSIVSVAAMFGAGIGLGLVLNR